MHVKYILTNFLNGHPCYEHGACVLASWYSFGRQRWSWRPHANNTAINAFALDNLMTSLEQAQNLSYECANHVSTAGPIDVPVVASACLFSSSGFEDTCLSCLRSRQQPWKSLLFIMDGNQKMQHLLFSRSWRKSAGFEFWRVASVFGPDAINRSGSVIAHCVRNASAIKR